MSAATEALVSTVAAAVAAVAAAAALVVALIALIVARRTLQEARTTTKAQRETLKATEAVVASTGKLVSRVEESTLALHMILTESQATRGLELCRGIARQVFEVRREMLTVRELGARDWHELNDAKLLLAAILSGLPDEELPACRRLAAPSTDPRFDDTSADEAAEEVRTAIERWRLRLAEVATQANALLRRLALASDAAEPAS
ncbi:MAG TPA: hypothetical protein VND96_13615 [Candidatus Micrarchaeaceae archaeon]|nr:hypothetical protein [Candidatus Micrarchaeaceae archaeon]